MTSTIVAFFALGVLFGLVTFPVRHHCSEGSVRPTSQAGLDLVERLKWAVLCSALWPILALSGGLSWLRLARGRARRND
jgi:hypothetical protein